jgi:hypothetical protein
MYCFEQEVPPDHLHEREAKHMIELETGDGNRHDPATMRTLGSMSQRDDRLGVENDNTGLKVK